MRYLLLETGQGFVQDLVGCEQGALGKRSAKQVLEKFLHPVVGDQLVLIQVGCQGLDPKAVLRRLVHPIRKGRLVHGAACLAGLLLRPVLGHLQLQGRYVHHLAPFDRVWSLIGKADTASLAMCHLVQFYLVRVVNHLQGVTGMAFLGAAFLTSLLAQALRFGKTVAGRGLAAVSAVGVDLIFELLDPFRESGNLHGLLLKDLLKGGDQIGYSIDSFVVDGLDILTLHRRSRTFR